MTRPAAFRKQPAVFGGTARAATCCRQLLLLTALLTLVGCAAPLGLLEAERAAIAANEEALVLLRVTCSLDGQPEECFGKFGASEDGPIVAFGLGAFETLGEPRSVWPRFLTEASRQAGWTFFLLRPGVHYLGVAGPISGISMRNDLPQLLRDGPRWRIDIPPNAGRVYVGSLQLAGKNAGTLMFGGKVIQPAETAAIHKSEDELARRVLAEFFADAGEMKTIPLRQWQRGEPIIIRSPPRALPK